MSKRSPRPSKQAPAPDRRITATTPSHALSASDDDALKEILDEGQALVDTMEAALRRFAQLVVRRAFAEDHASARDPDAHPTPLYSEIIRRAGGPTLKLNAKVISLWVRIAAWERTITSEEFRRLDFTRKQYLLPLADPKKMADAAEHIVALKLTEADTRAYVATIREGTAAAPVPRLTPRRAGSAIDAFVERLTRHGALSRLEASLSDLDERERKALAKKVEEASEVLGRLKAALKK